MIKFTKMHGLGNDYVYIDCTKNEIENPKQLSEYVSRNHFGVGSDGLILICISEVADFKMRMFNKDGSEGKMCGNGIRCVGKFVYDKGLTNKKEITVETLGGIKLLKLNTLEEKVQSVEVDMGEPVLEASLIPAILERNSTEIEIKALDKLFKLMPISVGNPHAVTLVDNVKEFEVEKYGPILECDSHFPDKANIEFIEVVDRENIIMRVWERGSGETLACGTGATASSVACIIKGLTKRRVKVELLGGVLDIEWREDNNHVYMTGPAVTVFEGELNI